MQKMKFKLQHPSGDVRGKVEFADGVLMVSIEKFGMTGGVIKLDFYDGGKTPTVAVFADADGDGPTEVIQLLPR